MTTKKPNHLIGENSPYLLQHAYNPVDWHRWGSDALHKAGEENKLLVISIGYAACHWCHVMEHESFEDEEVAEAMNRDFISIKVDREERPDIDHVYMTAAYATTGRGGWPLNVIALPDQRPVFAGTYYSKRDWLHILKYFSELYLLHPDELLHQASEIENGMKRQQYLPCSADSGSFSDETLHNIFYIWKEDLDFINGGTLGGPKFPMPGNIEYLLRYGAEHANSRALEYVELTMDKMAMGGIYDHLGGGFSRYSVDALWHVPHFEKMLYDNAQLISLYSKGYSLTKKEAFKIIVEESVAFIERELTSSDGLFFASIDADSSGSEGAFYTWTNDELRKYLGDDSKIFLEYYSCEDRGNWENNLNVLRKSLNDEAFKAKHGISGDQLSAIINVGKNELFRVRANRIRPTTDDKIITAWNALMISAFTDAARVFNRPDWLDKAIDAATFYQNHLTGCDGKIRRNAKAGSSAIAGFLDDYCFLIKSFIDLYQSTMNETWLTLAELLTREVIMHFTADKGPFFRLSSNEEPQLIQEPVELSDNVIPSSNSQMAGNLFILGHLLGNEKYLQRSEEMLNNMLPQIKRNPSFHSNWMQLLAGFLSGPTLVKIVGDESLQRLKGFSGYYLPNIIFSGNHTTSAGGIMPDHEVKGITQIYICIGKTCFKPVETVEEAMLILEKR